MLVMVFIVIHGARLSILRNLSSALLLLAALLLAAVPQGAMAAQPVNSATLRLGTAWYPEQWPESRWDADLSLMEQAHLNVVRMGEFAWSTMEPSEGHLDFGWLDRAIALAARHHIAVVLGTPTAAPPAWLTSRYPGTLRVDEAGHRAEHGGRQQFSFASPRYRELAAQIARVMAQRYGHNPNVIGWQIDNEIGAPTFDVFAQQQWHAWLTRKYGTIAELNRRWTTAYWSQTYDTFDQVPFHSRNENPALLLDYKHFVTETWTSYIKNQIDAIRPLIDPSQFITTNTMHWNNTFDHYILHRHLDLAAWDDYVPDGHLDPALNAAQHDLVRGYKQRNFWVMETQPAFVNWGKINAALPPGMVREMAWQAVGHGADAVLYWQWRSALNGQEQYHGTLIGPDGLPVPVYAEVQRIGAEFALAANALTGTSPHSRVAILQSYDSHWAIDFQRHSDLFDYDGAVMDVYRAAAPLAQSIDIVSPDTDLTSYAVVFAPALNVLSDALAEHLLAYVRGGGRIVLGPRSGMKNADDGLQPERQPGALAAALGAHVEQFYALDPEDPQATLSGELGSGAASIWAEVLKLDSPATTVLLSYTPGTNPGADRAANRDANPDQASSNGWLAGRPAAVRRSVGQGSLTYIGAALDPSLMQAAVAHVLNAAGVKPILSGLPAGVELMQRSRPGHGPAHLPVWILINHTSATKSVSLPHPMHDLLQQQRSAPEVSLDLPAHGVAVLVPETAQPEAAQ